MLPHVLVTLVPIPVCGEAVEGPEARETTGQTQGTQIRQVLFLPTLTPDLFDSSAIGVKGPSP